MSYIASRASCAAVLRFGAVQSTGWKKNLILLGVFIALMWSNSSWAQSVRAYRGCSLFETELERFSAGERWEKRLREMLLDDPEKFWAFVTGQSGVPKEILSEVNRQRDCLLKAILIEPGIGPSVLKSLGIDSQSSRQAISRARRGRLLGWARRKLQRSHYRSAKTQAAIWKSRLTRRGEEETLRTSSAPGTSRHHWGTDIDVFATDSRKFRRRGPFHAAYLWMQKNGPRFGFFQPFQGEGGRGISYIEERWHWSYGPIAEPLLKLVGEHVLGYERNLIRVWRSYEKRWNEKRRIKAPFFSHAENVWRHFVFNVSEGGFLWGAPGENLVTPGSP